MPAGGGGASASPEPEPETLLLLTTSLPRGVSLMALDSAQTIQWIHAQGLGRYTDSLEGLTGADLCRMPARDMCTLSGMSANEAQKLAAACATAAAASPATPGSNAEGMPTAQQLVAKCATELSPTAAAVADGNGGGGLARVVLDLTALRAELAKVNGVGEVGSGSFTDTWQCGAHARCRELTEKSSNPCLCVQLRRRAAADGVDGESIEAARDSGDPKSQMIELIVNRAQARHARMSQ